MEQTAASGPTPEAHSVRQQRGKKGRRAAAIPWVTKRGGEVVRQMETGSEPPPK